MRTAIPSSTITRLSLGDGAALEYHPAFIHNPSSVLESLLELTFEQRSLRMYGRQVPQPRLTRWVGDRPYTYSGTTFQPQPWDPTTRHLLDAVNRFLGGRPNPCHLNAALLNHYRGPRDSVGPHADDEPEIDGSLIAVLSFGTVRPFRLRENVPTGPHARVLTVEPEPGSLLLMWDCQRSWVHGVPKGGPEGTRISVTLRRMVPS